MALAELHRVVKAGPIELQFFAGDQDLTPLETDPMGSRRFTGWRPDFLRTVVEGAGFDIEALTIRKVTRLVSSTSPLAEPSPFLTSSALGCAG